jgi:hypothetical protein
MKKIKWLFYSAGFVLALSTAFAFKPVASPYSVAYFKSPAPFCTATTTCNGGSAACLVSGVAAYTDQGSCTIPAGMH